jgi:hypothetical protein
MSKLLVQYQTKRASHKCDIKQKEQVTGVISRKRASHWCDIKQKRANYWRSIKQKEQVTSVILNKRSKSLV